MPFTIVRNDITRMEVDAVVNAANSRLQRGGGVCGAIFAAAGAAELQAACDKIGHCNTGSAVATEAFGLPARHIIHAVGPIWQGGAYHEEESLRGCYRSALTIAHDLGDASIAFPLISSGIYGYPKGQAIEVALDEIRAFLDEHEMDVYLTIFDAASLRAGKARFSAIAEYIDDTYVDASPYRRRAAWEQTSQDVAPESCPTPLDEGGVASCQAPAPGASVSPHARRLKAKPAQQSQKASASLHDTLASLFDALDAPFSTTLMHMIDERGFKDSEVYKRANLSRQHFSKIRSNPAYRPKKQTVLALAVALGLDLGETRLLLERAGFSLTHADKRDVIVEYFIERGVYDIYEINLALYAFDQPLLG